MDPTPPGTSSGGSSQRVDVPAPDDTSNNSDASSSAESDAEMVDFEDQDETDVTGAGAEARNIKLDFDRQDVKSWLNRFEIRIEFAGVRSQWLKRLCLENLLPQDIANCCKDYLNSLLPTQGLTD